MSINNREDANEYYQIINGLVDDYIVTHKIRPSNLKKYLKPGGEGFNKFIDRNGLKDIKNSDLILRDILDDREHMEKDGILTFESFKFFESEEFKIESLSKCLYKGIEKADNKMEKILADYFDSSLGQIDIVDAGKHIFKVDNWKKDDVYVIIYSDEEIDVIINNIIEYLYLELSKKKIELTKTISIELSDLIKSDLFSKQMEDMFKSHDESGRTMKTITDCLAIYKYEREHSGYHIWIKNDQYM